MTDERKRRMRELARELAHDRRSLSWRAAEAILELLEAVEKYEVPVKERA